MCGICGQLVIDGARAPDEAGVYAMNELLSHRGPDSDGYFADGPVALAARRLAIIDVEHGDQPIASEDGSVVAVQNGEIYNHEGLRDELRGRGHTFATRCDTEVLVHLYEEHGPSFVERLRGMFAVAVWDGRRRRLVLARDRFGIKPLFYRHAGGTLSFASELKALVRGLRTSHEVDLEALEAFLAFNSIPAPLTIFEEVRKLPAGHILVAQGSDVSISRYARPGPRPRGELRREGAEELAAELRDALADSVSAHLVSDVPVGVLLSGGVDSSALTALAATHSDSRVSTFSIGFHERAFDELDRARLVAKRYDTDHHELVMTPDAAALLPELAATFDEPFADSSALPTYLVCRMAAEHVKVVLSGEGGDELFGGYETYVAHGLARRVGWAAPLLRPLVELLPHTGEGVTLDYKAKRFIRAASLPPLDRHHAFKEIFSAEARAELLSPARRAGGDPLAPHRARYGETADAEPLARLLDVDLGTYLVDDLLVKTDRASMAHSLEVRVPFLDTVVVDLAAALPARHKVRGFAKKRLLRRALAPLVPEELLRARKQGFSMPAAAWLRGELAPLAREVLSPERTRERGFFEPAAVTRLLEAHIGGREDLSRQLWGLLSFSLWHDSLRDPAAPRRAAPSSPIAEPR